MSVNNQGHVTHDPDFSDSVTASWVLLITEGKEDKSQLITGQIFSEVTKLTVTHTLTHIMFHMTWPDFSDSVPASCILLII